MPFFAPRHPAGGSGESPEAEFKIHEAQGTMTDIRLIFRDLWYRRPPAGRDLPLLMCLIPLSWAYGAAIARRNRRYDAGVIEAARLPCPVISIGNLTVGGTGKTPLTMLTARGLQARGFRPAVLSRGYGGRRSGSGNVVSDGRRVFLSPEECGDEPALLAANLPGVPVITGPERRVSGLLAVEKFGADVLVLDDAFQHRRLARDVDILLLDAQTPLGNRRLLPAGPLREPPRPALGRAHIIVKTGVEAPPRNVATDSVIDGASRPVFRACYEATGLTTGGGSGETIPPEGLAGRRILAFTAIAAPEKFRATLTALGAEIVKFLAFPDHYFYKERDLQDIAATAEQLRAEMIVTTAKDGVKLSAFRPKDAVLSILQIGLRMDPDADRFLNALINRISR